MERKGKCKSCKGKIGLYIYIFYFSNAEHTHKIRKRKKLKRKAKQAKQGRGKGKKRKRKEKKNKVGMKESGNVVEGKDIHVQRKKRYRTVKGRPTWKLWRREGACKKLVK